ncbi:reprolysin-like metallopeptidase [Algicola sagamiensis]|uniref:reprolysin-like metallopeptidase n=1 Tax=Algicola sagamiensis TaxID=163869 RepID=UPI00036FE9D7|nr:zinc-dependent metalloprotease family protein [Algicola sagamiensis]
MNNRWIRMISMLLALFPSFWVTAALWESVSMMQREGMALNPRVVEYQLYRLDIPRFQNRIEQAQIQIEVPAPDGQMVSVLLSNDSVMAPELAAKFPEIKSYIGKDDTGQQIGRFGMSPYGFHGMYLYQGKYVFIDAVKKTDGMYYQVYTRDGVRPPENFPVDKVLYQEESRKLDPPLKRAARATSRRTLRLAISTTGEYSAFHFNQTSATTDADKKSAVAAELAKLVTRVNQVYEVDVNITFQLIANNDAVIYLDAATDPFTNNTSQDIDINDDEQAATIGVANYDIGHVVSTGGGGFAGLGVACSSSAIKSQGVTGASSPEGDAFYIDFVSHELGHQLNARHTFNGTTSNCGGSRSSGVAYEPGSGTTVMAYAGICDTQNLQSNTDPYFHAASIDEINAHLSDNTSCGTTVVQTNDAPVADAGGNFTIPANTPFMLTGSGTDADGDTLLYVWEQFDLGTASSSVAEMVDNGSRPLFRSFTPTTSTERSFPKVSDVLQGGTPSLGETYPTTSRTMNFRLTVRDQNGGTDFDNMQVAVDAASGPFTVTQPTESSVWEIGSQQTVTWNVANTNAPPVNCTDVKIELSTNGGTNFTETLIASTPNDGSATITVGNNVSSNGRIKVSCVNHIVYAVSAKNHAITTGTTLPASAITVAIPPSVEDTVFTVLKSQITLSNSDDFTFQVVTTSTSNYTVSGAQVTPSANFTGSLDLTIEVSPASLASSTTKVAQVTITPVNDAPIANDFTVANLQAGQQTTVNVLSNTSDVDGDALTVTTATIVSGNGTLQSSTNGFTYTAAAGDSGTVTVDYTISDGDGETDVGRVSIPIIAGAPSTDPGSGDSGSGDSGSGDSGSGDSSVGIGNGNGSSNGSSNNTDTGSTDTSTNDTDTGTTSFGSSSGGSMSWLLLILFVITLRSRRTQ